MSSARRSVRTALAAALFLALVAPGAAQAEAAVAPSAIVSPANGLTVVVDDLTHGPAVLDYEHSTLRVSGRVRLFDPATQTYIAHSGGAIRLFVRGTQVGQGVPVAQDGTFAVAWAASGYVDDAPWPADLRWTPDVDTLLAFGATFPTQTPVAEFPLAATSSSWRIVLDSRKLTVKMPSTGQKTVTITGTLQRSIAGQWQPQAGVWVTAGPETVVTDSSGRFSGRATVFHDHSVAVDVYRPSSLFLADVDAAPSTSVTVDVIPKSRIVLSRAVMLRNRSFSVRGRLNFDRASAVDAVRALQLQESKNCSTGWRTVSTIRTWSDSRFDLERPVPHPTWCLRLRFAGTAAVQPSVSSTYRTALRETRIAGFAVKAPTVPWDLNARFSGKVQVRGKNGWYSLGKKTSITLWWKPRHAKYWDYWVPSETTNANGNFSFLHPLFKDASWYLTATINDGKHLWAYSPTVFLDRP